MFSDTLFIGHPSLWDRSASALFTYSEYKDGESFKQTLRGPVLNWEASISWIKGLYKTYHIFIYVFVSKDLVLRLLSAVKRTTWHCSGIHLRKVNTKFMLQSLTNLCHQIWIFPLQRALGFFRLFCFLFN